MTYDAIETGPLGRPIELYEFVVAGAFVRVTSAATTQSDGANDYPPLAGLSRTEPRQSTEAGAGEIKVKCPSNFIVAAQFRGTVPSVPTALTIFGRHLNDAAAELVTVWKGTVVSSDGSDGRAATLNCLPPTRLFAKTIPRVVYSATCNHQLFDLGCTVNRDDFKFATVLGTFDGLGTTTTITGLRARAAALQSTHGTSLSAQELDDYWLRGYIKVGSSNPEYRMIVQTDIGGNPDVVRITYPFRLAAAGQSIDVFAGCNHGIDLTVGHCQRKFLNAINFGGFPYVPTINPFGAELDSGLSPTAAAPPSRFRI